MIVDENFLKVVASEGRHTFIYAGMTELDGIEKAVKIFRDAKCSFEFMHTVSTYPIER